MIKPESLSAEWITEKKKKFGKDPTIIEGMIFALYLLEHLKLSGLDFIFKGGTSLVLLLDQPKRFSVDIDIILDPSIKKADLESYLGKIVDSSSFIRMELDGRRSYQPGIPKAHYKFFYLSNFSSRDRDGHPVSNPEREILLDIVFTGNPYTLHVEKPLQTEWLQTDGKITTVRMPDLDSITGDKLTAFAPNTTGVPYGIEKEKEIMKQLFDIGCLFDHIANIEVIKRAFDNCVRLEMEYRPDRKIESPDQVLRDTIKTSLIISRIVGLSSNEATMELREVYTGINQFRHYVFEGTFGLMNAKLAASKAAYLAAMILTDYKGEIQKYNPGIPLTDYLITNPDYNSLNKRLKFVAGGEPLYYWYKTLQILYLVLC
jgi:hypothetical protein